MLPVIFDIAEFAGAVGDVRYQLLDLAVSCLDHSKVLRELHLKPVSARHARKAICCLEMR